MKNYYLFALLLAALNAQAQERSTASPMDPLLYGVVLEYPAMKDVTVQKDIVYLHNAAGGLSIDIYSPPAIAGKKSLPAIIFLNAIGEIPGQRKVKTWGIYSSWPKLMAANGYIGISMETDGSHVQESIQWLFDFLDKNADRYHINRDRLGIYAASANVGQSVSYLMGDRAYKGIRAAVLYYGSAPSGPFRKDLPVLFVISEGDVRPNSYNNLWNEVLKNNAPWTIKMGTAMPHAFDAYADNDDARKIIRETIAYWKNQLDPVPAPMFQHSKYRDMFGLLRMNRSKGLEILQSIVEEHPEDIRALSFYGDILRENGNTDKAETVYKKILQLQPADIQALVQMAGISYLTGKNAEAERYLLLAEHTGKMTNNSYGNLAFVLLQAGKDEEAAKYYEKAVSLQPNAHDYYNLACAYAKYNQRDKAFEAIGKSLEMGYASKQLVENDPDLTSLHNDPRYQELLLILK